MAYTQFLTTTKNANGTPCNGDRLWTGASLKDFEDALLDMSGLLPNDGGVIIETRDKLTVPSPWSSIISFDIILDSKNDYGEVGKRTFNEWRTLLSLLALKKIKNIPLVFKTVDLSKYKKGFGRNILSQYPDNGIFKNEQVGTVNKKISSWSHITFLELEGDVIGALTPSNIVCSVYNFSEVKNAGSWLEKNKLMFDGRITDPIDYILNRDGMPDIESFSYMCAWLEKVKEFLLSSYINKGNEEELNFENVNSLVKRINEFLQDLKNEAADKKIPLEIIRLRESVLPSVFMHMREMIESIQGENSWLGLLSAVAYAPMSDYKITFEPLTSETKDMFHPTIAEDPTSMAILLDGYCIGVLRNKYVLSVPTTGLDPSAKNKLINAGLMNENGEFENPVNFVLATPERYVFINGWLESVLEKLGNNLANEEALKEIGTFLNNISSEYAKKPDYFKCKVNKYCNEHSDGYKLFSFKFQESATSVYQLLSSIKLFCDFEHIIADDCLIDGTSKLLMFSENTIGNDLLLLYNKSLTDGKISVNIGGMKVFDSSNVFENKIYYVENIDGTKENLNINYNRKDDCWFEKKIDGTSRFFTVLWPLKRSVLEKVDSNTIYNSIFLSYDKEKDECKVTLALSVNEKRNTVCNVYDGPYKSGAISSEVIADFRVPGCSIWPYVSDAKAYFIYETKAAKSFDNAAGGTGMENFYKITYMPREDCLSNILELTSDTKEYCRSVIFRTTIPKYLLFENGRNYYGAVLLKSPETASGFGVNYEIGLDFGTTSTTVYANTNKGKDPVQVRFDENGLAVYGVIKNSYDDSGNFFIPSSYSSNKFYPTLLRLSSNNESINDENGIKLPLLNSSIIYKYKYSDRVTGTTNDRSVVKSNIKWDPDDQEDTRKYLRQIVFQTLMYAKVNGGKKIKWYASFPSAYSKQYELDYTSMLESITKQMERILGINAEESQEIKFYTESVAAARYIVDRAAFDNYDCVMVIDIGGGSTDISTWIPGSNEVQGICQSSVEIASRKLFIKPLQELIRKESDLKKFIGSKGSPFEKIEESINGYADAPNYETLVEQFLLLNGEAFKTTVDTLSELSNVNTFRRKVVAGFYGLVFYAVKSLLMYYKKYRKKQDFHNIVIRLGGNGAKMYEWLKPAEKSSVASLVKDLFIKDDFNVAVTIEFNEHTAKTEAAKGLLNNIGKVNDPEKVALNGSSIEFKYRDEKGNIITENIEANENMLDKKGIKLAYSNDQSIQGISFTLREQSDMYREFMDGLVNGIFQNSIKINISEERVMATVKSVMDRSIRHRRLTSPLLAQLEEVINSIN